VGGSTERVAIARGEEESSARVALDMLARLPLLVELAGPNSKYILREGLEYHLAGTGIAFTRSPEPEPAVIRFNAGVRHTEPFGGMIDRVDCQRHQFTPPHTRVCGYGGHDATDRAVGSHADDEFADLAVRGDHREVGSTILNGRPRLGHAHPYCGWREPSQTPLWIPSSTASLTMLRVCLRKC